jgi:pimeloyl-ACP methyl ester carboxylesterase
MTNITNRSDIMLKKMALALIATVGISLFTVPFTAAQDDAVQSGYASVNGLEMYYEIQGTGDPLVVIHGSFMSIESMGDIVPRLAETRQVIAVELQGHGRTGDIDRALSPDLMADDVAALLQELEIEQADIFGYSLGGAVALHMAIRHPEMVRKLVVVSANYTLEGWYPELAGFMETMSPDIFAGSPIETEYKSLAPDPDGLPNLVSKIQQLATNLQAIPDESIQAITAPSLIMVGDSDNVRPEHALDLFKLLGGGVPGDLVGLPSSQLAVIPGATHTSILSCVEVLVALTVEFLDAPLPEAQ